MTQLAANKHRSAAASGPALAAGRPPRPIHLRFLRCWSFLRLEPL